MDYYCCSGCALASRIPLGDGRAFPVSPGLIVALAFAFGLFNQVLFGVLGGAVADEGRVEVGARLQWVSLAIGGLLALVGAAFAAVPRGRSSGDLVVAPLLVLASGALVAQAWRAGVAPVVWPAIAANLLMAAWLARGWCRRALVRRRREA